MCILIISKKCTPENLTLMYFKYENFQCPFSKAVSSYQCLTNWCPHELYNIQVSILCSLMQQSYFLVHYLCFQYCATQLIKTEMQCNYVFIQILTRISNLIIRSKVCISQHKVPKAWQYPHDLQLQPICKVSHLQIQFQDFYPHWYCPKGT